MHRVTALGESTTLADRKRRAAQRMILGFEGVSPSDALRDLLKEGPAAGFILFTRNLEEPRQVLELNRELRSLVSSSSPPLLTIDHEGGRVQRIREGVTRLPPLRFLGQCDRLDWTKQHAEIVAGELRAMGFNLVWAPVADVDSNRSNPVIGDRAFSARSQDVARHVAAWIASAQAAGLMCSAKHFPGHGDTEQDSHLELPKVERERPDIEQLELPPFRAAIEAEVATIMTAHVLFPAWDESMPATMSHALLRDLLREELGYQGLVVSDDLDMKAVADRFPLEQQLQRATEAGVDVFLLCKDAERQFQTFEHLVRLQEQDPRHDRWARDSMARLQALRLRFLRSPPVRPGLELLDHPLHREWMSRICAEGAS